MIALIITKIILKHQKTSKKLYVQTVTLVALKKEIGIDIL